MITNLKILAIYKYLFVIFPSVLAIIEVLGKRRDAMFTTSKVFPNSFVAEANFHFTMVSAVNGSSLGPVAVSLRTWVIFKVA